MELPKNGATPRAGQLGRRGPATRAIEELMFGLKGRHTIVIVTHNMAQARRTSDECIFILLAKIIEHRRIEELILTPMHSKTAEYIEGGYG
jgi:phosphate transport system ATP-binding protein